MRHAKLLVAVRGLSGQTYPPGTIVRVKAPGEVVDAFVRGDWMSLSWWEFVECAEPAPGHRRPPD